MKEINPLNEALACDTEIGKQIGKIHGLIIAYRNGILNPNPSQQEIYSWQTELRILTEKRIANYKLLIKLYRGAIKYRRGKGLFKETISHSA